SCRTFAAISAFPSTGSAARSRVSRTAVGDVPPEVAEEAKARIAITRRHLLADFGFIFAPSENWCMARVLMHVLRVSELFRSCADCQSWPGRHLRPPRSGTRRRTGLRLRVPIDSRAASCWLRCGVGNHESGWRVWRE